MSFVFDSIDDPVVKQQCGFFEPKSAHHIIKPSKNLVYKGRRFPHTITENTAILYFPGSFGSFHKGHQRTVAKAVEMVRKITNDYIVIISPANSDYVAEKYGARSLRASNYYRFRNIVEWIDIVNSCDKSPLQNRVWVDLNPMLNNTCDQNFDTLIEQFVILNLGIEVRDLAYAPTLICGKDRDFRMIRDISEDMDVFYADDDTGESTSKRVQVFTEKPDLILRCHDFEEFYLFSKVYGKHYKTMKPLYIQHEKFLAMEYARMIGIKHTNCKDYRDFLEYHPISRKWINPLMHQGFVYNEEEFESLQGVKMLDSDSFTGSTSRFLRDKFKIHCIPLVDLSDRSNVELLDIDDLKTWNYPDVDLSYRMSLPAFTHGDHEVHANFVNELKAL